MKNRMLIFSTIASVTCLAFSTTTFAAEPAHSAEPTTDAPTTETKVGPVHETTESTTVTATAVHLSHPAEEVLKLSHAKLSEGAIVAYIMNSGSTYNLTVSEILYLREQGVSDFVITTMLDQSRKIKDGYKSSYARTLTTNSDGTVVMAFTNAVRTAPLVPNSATVYSVPDSYPGYYYDDYYGYYPYYYGSPGWSIEFAGPPFFGGPPPGRGGRPPGGGIPGGHGGPPGGGGIHGGGPPGGGGGFHGGGMPGGGAPGGGGGFHGGGGSPGGGGGGHGGGGGGGHGGPHG
jgi:hypothetical protein